MTAGLASGQFLDRTSVIEVAGGEFFSIPFEQEDHGPVPGLEICPFNRGQRGACMPGRREQQTGRPDRVEIGQAGRARKGGLFSGTPGRKTVFSWVL